MAVLGRARFARGDRSEAAAVVPLGMPGFLRSGKNFFPRRHYVRGFHTLYYEGFWRRIILYTKRSFLKFFHSLAIQHLLGVWRDKLFSTVWRVFGGLSKQAFGELKRSGNYKLSEFSISLPSHHFHQLVDFCFYILDFPFCDAINFQAISILQNLLEIHRNFCCCKDVVNPTKQILCSKRISIPFCDFLLNFGQRVGEYDDSKNYSFTKQRAMLLNCLLKLHPDLRQQIFSDDFLIKIYKQMRNDPPTVQICNLIVDDICVSLITSNKSEKRERLKTRLDLHLNWIKILFINEDIHPRSRQSMENKLLPKLLRSPETRNWFFDEFSMFIDFSRSSAHSKRALCVLLRLAIVHLYEIQNGQTMDWKELLLRHVGEEQADKEMFDALMDKDFETRLAAWSLLCSHPKGSQPVSQTEIELAKKFLVSGAMDLKTPAKRQAIFCQLGKLILRIREHSKSLLKLLQNNSEDNIQLKIYKKFLFWLCKLAFEFISNPDWHKKLMESLTFDSNIEINTIKNVEDELSEFCLTNGIKDENTEENAIDDDYEEENDEENSTPFSTRISALTLISLIFNPSIPLESDPFSTFLDLKHWIGKEEKQKLFFSLDDQFEACQKIALNLLNNFETIGWLQQNFYSQISDEEWLFLSVRPNMPRHQQAIKYRLQFILPRMELKFQINFIETLLTLSENSCSNVTKASKGKENYFLEGFLDPPQLHALINALHVSLPFVKFELLDNDLLFIKRIYSLCLNVDKIISPVVYSLSPEGFMPSMDVVSLCVKDYNIYAQQLSRTCFRAHKSISGIISYIFIQYLTSPIFSPRFSKNDFTLFLSQIAFYFWQKLTECRHRGAFEAASNEFTTVVCPRLWALCAEEFQIESYDKITLFPYNPRQWLKQILDALNGNDDSQKLCVTRRSAGLPHLIASLLENAPINELNDEQGLFHQTMRQLLACSELQNSELEIHCINVLRLLFMHSKFAELVLPHIECAFRLTINGSSSEIWQVRNAHTQLFAALIKRIFGTPAVERRTLHIETRCKQTSNEFFKRYPSLYEFFLSQMAYISDGLAENNNKIPQFGCKHLFLSFPLLITLTHLRPHISNLDDDFHYSLQPFLPNLLILLLYIPAYSIKALASAAIMSISKDSELKRILNWLFIQTKQHSTFNGTSNVSQNFVSAIQLLLSHINELKLSVSESVEKLSVWINQQKLFLNC